TRVEQAGGSATFTYTVNVTESGWRVSGNITVNNPNDWEDISASVGDAVTNANCTITGAAQTVLRSSSASWPYSCTFTSVPSAASGTNSANATWNSTASFTPGGSAASGPVGFTFGSLTVIDNFNGTTTTLGTIAAPTAPTTY